MLHVPQGEEASCLQVLIQKSCKTCRIIRFGEKISFKELFLNIKKT